MFRSNLNWTCSGEYRKVNQHSDVIDTGQAGAALFLSEPAGYAGPSDVGHWEMCYETSICNISVLCTVCSFTRRILLDAARAPGSCKRGAGATKVNINEAGPISGTLADSSWH